MEDLNILRLWCPRCNDVEYVLVHLVDTVKCSFTCLTCNEYVEVRKMKVEEKAPE